MDVLFIFLFFSTFLCLLFSGYPVAFVLGGTGVLFAALGTLIAPLNIADVAELRMIGFVANRVFDTISSYSLIPMSMFIFMGFMLDRSGIAERLLKAMRALLGPAPGGLAIAVVAIGVVLAASTGIIGASVVLLATIAVPTMFEAGYSRKLSLGTVGATGCLGILIPPSIMLVVMGDQLRIPVGDLFMGALLPGVGLAAAFVAFIVVAALLVPSAMPRYRREGPRQPMGPAILGWRPRSRRRPAAAPGRSARRWRGSSRRWRPRRRGSTPRRSGTPRAEARVSSASYGATIGVASSWDIAGSTSWKTEPCSNQLRGAGAPQSVWRCGSFRSHLIASRSGSTVW